MRGTTATPTSCARRSTAPSASGTNDPAAGWPEGSESAVVGELQRDVEVGAAEQGLHRLQVVTALADDAQLVTLDVGLDVLRALVANQLGDLLGVLLREAFLEVGLQPVLLARRGRLALVERLQRDAALDELGLQDVE